MRSKKRVWCFGRCDRSTCGTQWRKAIELLVNLSRGTQEFYEENLSNLLGAYEIRFVLRKVEGEIYPVAWRRGGSWLKRRGRMWGRLGRGP